MGSSAPNPLPLLELAVWLCALRPWVVWLDAGSWGRKLIAWIHDSLGAIAVASPRAWRVV